MTEQEIRRLFGQNVRYLRKMRNLSQMQLAEKTNIALNFISDIENARKWISPSTLSKLSAALEVHPSCFFSAFPSERKDEIDGILENFSASLLDQINTAIAKTMDLYR